MVVSVAGQNSEDWKLNTHPHDFLVWQWLKFYSAPANILKSLGIPNGYLASLILKLPPAIPGGATSSASITLAYFQVLWHTKLSPTPGPFHRHALCPPLNTSSSLPFTWLTPTYPSALSSFITFSQKPFLIPTSSLLCGISYICHFSILPLLHE